MIRLLAVILSLCIFASVAEAQKARTDPRLFQAEALLSEQKRGSPATWALLNDSFARHLHSDHSPAIASDLSALGAGYDQASGTRLNAGMLFYHIAAPLDLLRQIGGPQNEALLRIFEARLLMLAGQPERALELTTRTIAEMEASGNWQDAQMTSLLADAAVLAHRSDDPAAAQRYFARAMTCGAPRCPNDLVFRWLGPSQKATPEVERDPSAQLRQALTAAEALFDDDTVLADIQLEHDFFTFNTSKSLTQTLRLIASDRPLDEQEKRTARALADRLMTASGLAPFLMGHDSVAGQIRLKLPDPQVLDAFDADDVEYLDPDSYARDRFLLDFPLIATLLDHSDIPSDQIIADLLRARLLLMHGDARAGAALQSLIDRARRDGFSNAQLFSPLMDLWATARLTDDAALASQIETQLGECLENPCDQDIALTYFDRIYALPDALPPGNLAQHQLILATSYVEETFPQDRMRLADLYSTAPSQSHPMDAADSAELHMRYAESAIDPDPVDLVQRAARAMDTLVYAGRYNDATAMGDRIAARVPDTALSGRFFQIRARAAHRIDDPRTEAFYRQAVARGAAGDLALDLLDTRFLDVLESALDAGPDDLSIRARLRYRQGRFVEAADLLAVLRLQLEETIDEADPYARYWDLKLLAYQEAHYRDAAGEADEAERLRDLGGRPSWFHADWKPMPDTPRTQSRIVYAGFGSDDSYSKIRDVIEWRDKGNYEGAAQYMKSKHNVAVMADANGTYLDAQTLWQMAFTFVRAGETDIAFDLMNRAARIAATLSFEGAGGSGGGTLQLLERDRWRYLLFVDIAWAAVSGQSPEDMVVVSRY